MARSFYHEFPEQLTVETEVVNTRPGSVLLATNPFYPGGGGQLADRGVIRWNGGEISVSGFEKVGDRVWAQLADPIEISGTVEASIDPLFRQMMRELHTALHVINAIVFQKYHGALVTTVQMHDDETARIGFDVAAGNNELKELEPAINDALRQDFPVVATYVTEAEAAGEAGLLRSRDVTPPPTSDGMIRVIDIVGLDRQACGGTHLSSTGACRPIRILKVDNKGRGNRQLRLTLVS